MTFTRRTAQLLHDDHQQTITMIEALDQMIARAKRTTPDVHDPVVQSTLKKAARAIAEEVGSHFEFEENELFTRLEEIGDGAISAHLRQEHKAILPLGRQVASLADNALANGFTDAQWAEFRSVTGELIERMFAHIQKEEMALLPILDDLLDPETDMQLASDYNDTH